MVASIWLGGAFGLLRVGQLDRLARDRLTLPAFIRINVYVLLIMAALPFHSDTHNNFVYD